MITTIPNVGFEPRGLAITNDGDADDTDETVYVTQFLSLPIAGKVDGQDDAKDGYVTVISTCDQHSDRPGNAINPIADTGFKATGDALARIPPGDPANPANFTFTTGAYPNQLNNIAIKGNFAFIPNTGASPNGPVRFDVNTHSLLSVIDRGHRRRCRQDHQHAHGGARPDRHAEALSHAAVGDRVQARLERRLRGQRREQRRGQGGDQSGDGPPTVQLDHRNRRALACCRFRSARIRAASW